MRKALYLGDDFLTGAAAYLGGVMTHSKIPFDYVPSAQELTLAQVAKPYGLYILSDYPSKNIRTEIWSEIRIAVSKGAGLLMVGGWESFYGLKGEYQCGPAEEMLPVRFRRSDDRHNYCHGLIPVKGVAHAITAGLPWNQPAVVCGYNEIMPKEDAKVLLNLRALKPSPSAVKIDKKNIPLLVIGTYGKGKTAAFATDFAPHWVGGLVDWGTKRIKAQAKNGGEIEVGEHYVKFISQLVKGLVG